jgi:hypothetical protein
MCGEMGNKLKFIFFKNCHFCQFLPFFDEKEFFGFDKFCVNYPSPHLSPSRGEGALRLFGETPI